MNTSTLVLLGLAAYVLFSNSEPGPVIMNNGGNGGGFVPGQYSLTQTPNIFPGDPGWGSYTLQVNTAAELQNLLNQGYVIWQRYDASGRSPVWRNPAVKNTKPGFAPLPTGNL